MKLEDNIAFQMLLKMELESRSERIRIKLEADPEDQAALDELVLNLRARGINKKDLSRCEEIMLMDVVDSFHKRMENGEHMPHVG
jgi:hypothetical protein